MSTEQLSTSKKYEDVSLLDWVKSHIRRAYRFGQRGDRTLEDFVAANETILKIQIAEHDRKQLAAIHAELESLKQNDRTVSRAHMDTPEKQGDNVCQKCGARNPAWYADNELFNKVNGSPDGVMCPNCFEEIAEKRGVNVMFKAVDMKDESEASQA
jgi:chromosome condensin MukBEF ATPase and DNA-binding subunit MukB